jgi:hypothetical protein
VQLALALSWAQSVCFETNAADWRSFSDPHLHLQPQFADRHVDITKGAALEL